jgi:hypothetical protein
MSNHYEQGDYSVIALVSVSIENNKNDHQVQKGIVIDDIVRKNILPKYELHEIHAAAIYMLIKELENIEKVIVCGDIKPVEKVMSNVQIVHPGIFGRLKSLIELRRETGDAKLRSAADGFARNINSNYPKRKNVKRKKEYFDDGSVIILNSLNSTEYKEFSRVLGKIRNG